MPAALTTNGLIPPPDFPTVPYEAVHARIARVAGGHPLYDHYAGAWNALAFRFQSLTEYGDEFSQLISAHGASPPPPERYRQERALFSFFTCAFSIFECTAYGVYAIGAFLSPAFFPLGTPKEQQQVSPTRARDAVRSAFPGDPLVGALAALFSDPGYQELREIRNILTHRTAPGRRMFVSVGDDESLPTQWKLNDLALDGTLIPTRRDQAAVALAELLDVIDGFAARHLP